MCFTALFYWNKSLEQYHSSFVRLLYLPWVLPSSEHLLSLLNPTFTFIMLWHWGKFPLPLLSVSLAQTGSNTGTAYVLVRSPLFSHPLFFAWLIFLSSRYPTASCVCKMPKSMSSWILFQGIFPSPCYLFFFWLAYQYLIQFVQIMSLPLDYFWTLCLTKLEIWLNVSFSLSLIPPHPRVLPNPVDSISKNLLESVCFPILWE